MIIRKFNQALNWNAFLYVIHNGLFFTTSLFLYKNLSSEDFSLWANINCTVFLFLLWTDFGFRKSIPRYAPEFGANKKKIKSFITTLVSFQFFALTIETPFFFFLSRFFTRQLGLHASENILYLGCALFFVEGMIRIIRLVYHSYFLQKQFNLLVSIVLIAQMIPIIFLIVTNNSQNALLKLFGIKIFSGLVILTGSLVMLLKLYKKISQSGKKETSWEKKRWEFIQHSGIMWLTSNTKSMTERNFLVPLFTFLLGHEQANIFKIANDAALFFQRVAIRTIGTTDTSLFSYTDSEKKGKNSLAKTFVTLTTKLLTLCIPLLGISSIIFFCGLHIQTNTFISKLSFILTVCYLLHVLLSPYQRLLEVKRKYKALFIIYIPYFLLITLLFFSPIISSFGLLGSVIVIHGVRLVSAAIASLIAHKQFKIRFFTRQTQKK